MHHSIVCEAEEDGLKTRHLDGCSVVITVMQRNRYNEIVQENFLFLFILKK